MVILRVLKVGKYGLYIIIYQSIETNIKEMLLVYIKLIDKNLYEFLCAISKFLSYFPNFKHNLQKQFSN